MLLLAGTLQRFVFRVDPNRLVGAQCRHRIHAHGAQRRYDARERRHDKERCGDADEDDGIARRHVEQQWGNEPTAERRRRTTRLARCTRAVSDAG
jgi:hypothetical protein